MVLGLSTAQKQRQKKKNPSWKSPEMCVFGGGESFWVGVHPQRSLDEATESCHYPEGAKISDDHAVGRRNLW